MIRRRRIPSSSEEEEWDEKVSSPDIFNPFANEDAAELNLLNTELPQVSESPLPIFLISAHGLLTRKKAQVPDNSLYIYDSHCGVSSEGNHIERAFFKQRLPPDSEYLSFWRFDKNANKIGGDNIILKAFPEEEYYDSMMGYLLDFRHKNSKQTYEDDEIDECDTISIQKSGIYLYDNGATYDVKKRANLKYVYYNSDGELVELKRDKSSGFKNARESLSKNERPFYIITREDVERVYQGSIYPTVEDLLMYFDEESDFMYYRDFVPIVDEWDSTIGDCFKRYQPNTNGCIIIAPSCRSNQNISEERFSKMRRSSDETVSKRYSVVENLFSRKRSRTSGGERKNTGTRKRRHKYKYKYKCK